MDVILWLVFASAMAQLLIRLIVDSQIWVGPLILVLMSGTALALRYRQRRSA